MENQIVTVRAVVAFPSMTREDQMSGKYSVQLGNLSDAAVEKLEELGISVKFKEDNYNRGKFIECRSNYPIDNSKFQTVVDSQGLPMDANLIGPGSVVRATLKPFEWTMGRRSGVSARVQKIVVEELSQPEAVATDEAEDVL